MVIPDISIPDDLGPHVPVPNISVTSASSSSPPIQKCQVERVEQVVGVLNHLKLHPAQEPFQAGSDTETDESTTPESPFVFSPLPATGPRNRQEYSLSGRSSLSPLNIFGSCQFGGGEGSRRGEGAFLGPKKEGGKRELESLSSMSPIREEATEDSLYSSLEGSEMSDQELDERRRRRSERGREARWKGEMVQPRLLALRVSIGQGDIGDGGHSDGTEETGENVPMRKISDCSNRSVDSGTKMSEISKDDDECHRKLSDLSEASQNNSEVEEEREGGGEGGGGGGEGGGGGRDIAESDSSGPVSPSELPPLRGRSGSVHNKVDFFNRWIQNRQESLASVAVRKKRSKLLRTQSEVVFSELPFISPSPRRGSLYPGQELQYQDSTAT